MKEIKYITILILTTILLASCVDNELPSFDDSEAFAAFNTPSAILNENSIITNPNEKGIIRIPVVAAFVDGVSGTVDFEFVDSLSTAVINDNYKLVNSNNTLNFSKENRIAYIDIKAVDNDQFTGDRVLSISLTNPQGLIIGADKTFNLTIVDDEHPLAFILGEKTIYAKSNYDGDVNWGITLEKDASDLSKVWITGLVNFGDIQPIYGVVNEEKNEIKIPVGQVTHLHSNYPKIILAGFDPEDTELTNPITDEYNIKGTISDNGVITLSNGYGSLVYGDEAMSDELGWWDLYFAGAQIK